MTNDGQMTIRDVARAAGVSTTTVSDALNGRGRLPDSTREKVIQVAAALGYSANPLARNLRHGRTGAIALYFPQNTLRLQYYVDLAIGAAEQLLDHDYALVLLPASYAFAEPPLHADGIIIADPHLADPMLTHLGSQRIPVVTCEADLTDGVTHAGTVESDHRSAMRELLDHLAAQGAHRVAVACPPAGTAFGRGVRQGHQDWITDNDAPELVWDIPFVSSQRDITAAVQEMLLIKPRVDAIVAVPDGVVTSALQVVLEAGLRVPGDLLVAGYVEGPELGGLSTPITAVDLHARRMGRDSSALLADILAGRVPHGTTRRLATTLQVRSSTTRTRPSES